MHLFLGLCESSQCMRIPDWMLLLAPGRGTVALPTVGGSSSLRSQVIASSDSPLLRPKAHAAARGQRSSEAWDQGDLGNTSCEMLSRRVRAALVSLGPSC